MKKLWNFKAAALLITFALCAVPIYAQPGQGQRGQGQGQVQGQGQRPGQGRMMTEEAAKERVARLAETLQLSDAQKTKLVDFEVELFKAGQKQRESAQAGGDREAMREFMTKQREMRTAKYKEVLTPKQLEQYNKMMEERRQQGPQGGQRGRNGN